MTITNQSNRVEHAGVIAIGEKPVFAFPITATSDLQVLDYDTVADTEIELAETTNYIVTINSGSEGGYIEMVTAIAATHELHIIRNTPTTQATDLAAGGDFSAPVIEAALDKLTKLCIEAQDQLDQHIVQEEELTAGVDYQAYAAALATLSTGTLAALQEAMTGLTAFAITYLDDATAVATRATLGAVAVTEMLFWENSALAWENEQLTWVT